MTTFIEIDEQVEWNLDVEHLFNRAVEACLDYMKCPYEVEVNLVISDNDEIQAINLEQRQIDKPTDILSFPMVEWDEIGEFEFLEEALEYFHPDSGELMLGDMILSYEKVEEQAKEYEHTLEREFSFLIVHSMLHLFGYDHMEDGERMQMEEAQSDIMDILGITR